MSHDKYLRGPASLVNKENKEPKDDLTITYLCGYSKGKEFSLAENKRLQDEIRILQRHNQTFKEGLIMSEWQPIEKLPKRLKKGKLYLYRVAPTKPMPHRTLFLEERYSLKEDAGRREITHFCAIDKLNVSERMNDGGTSQ